MTEREFALEVVRRLRDAGFTAYWAGGCVRDELFGLIPADYDVATDAPLEQVRKLFPRSKEVGASFGVVEVVGPKVEGGHLHVQVARFRADGPYSDGRRPDVVTFATAREDALRRDFTINGMFLDPIENRLIDHVGGRADLEARILRAVGDPKARFAEDKLRMLRAVRFAARFSLTIEPNTSAAIKQMAQEIGAVSAERIADELRRMLTHPSRVRSLVLLEELKLLCYLFPEVVPLRNLSTIQDRVDAPTIWQHTLAVVGLLPEPVSFPLAGATVLHDVGKGILPRERWSDHPRVGREIAESIAVRMRLSNVERDRIAWLVEHHHDLDDAPNARPSRLKPLFAHAAADDLFALCRANLTSHGHAPVPVDVAIERRDEWRQRGELDPPPLVTGNDLRLLGLKPGPQYRTILDAIREKQLDGDFHTRDDAIAFAKALSVGATRQ
jgi:poly(A) polymerase